MKLLGDIDALLGDPGLGTAKSQLLKWVEVSVEEEGLSPIWG
jgi:DNA replicative helicase MCM subunit Mcm2 (Cdc46/Mcm family)